MEVKELYDLVTKDFDDKIPLENIHPLHKAMLEECCENALNNPQKVESQDTLKYAVQIAFFTCIETLRGTLKAGLEFADTVNLNYRNQSFTITKDSPFLKD
ncbi:hypothetical protein FORMB_02190 [Formosa sp. Hel1_33_131]|uniref:hypothetical protein n=1 Tax=Formosa sp. Hel1_33_131 TaxID=1336794 RepID=UPI00084E3253|nr:hypothetical protein [Formosa sp. Hel1_33_131]AOR27281.1 hypothetical protein FORMB_02190 [Formosa sp. Hel1_33_131]